MDKVNRKEVRQRLKELPEYIVKQIIDSIGLTGIENDIAYKRIVEKKSVDIICDELCIGTSTFNRAFQSILNKIKITSTNNASINTTTDWFKK